MKVSVCIPAYNSERWIAEAIESALGQTEKDLEVCVWDDGSSDRTVEIAMSFDRVAVSKATHQGVEAAMNGAASMARGDVLVLMGSDDILKPEYVERTVALLSDEVGVSASLAELFDGHRAGMMVPKNLPRKELRERFYFGNFLYGGSVLKKSVFNEFGGYLAGFECCCDLDLLIRVLSKYEISVVEEPLYKFRVRSDSLSCTPMERQKELMVEIRRKHYRWRSIDGQLMRAA